MHRILNWRKWPSKVWKGVLLGGLIGGLLTVGGYVLNCWAASFDPRGGDGGGFLIGVPSILPLQPFLCLFQLFGGHLPDKWNQGDSIWQLYCLAMLLNIFILAALGGAIGYVAGLFAKDRK